MSQASTNWNGTPVVLNPGDNVFMPNTINGPMVIGFLNTSSQGSAGEIIYTSGGLAPQQLPAPALTNQPSILTGNWGGNNLTITNNSQKALQPVTIWIQAFGAGLAGQVPTPLTINTPVALNPTTPGSTTMQIAQGTALPRFMNLTFTASSSDLAIFAFQGGPANPTTGSNIYVVALNSPAGNTGGSGQPAAPAGYTATSGGNTYTYQFNWGSAAIYAANLSPAVATGTNPAAVSVLLQSL